MFLKRKQSVAEIDSGLGDSLKQKMTVIDKVNKE